MGIGQHRYERQRNAIDQLREQGTSLGYSGSATKKGKAGATFLKMDDPQNWLSNLASRICGYGLSLHVVEAFDEPPALLCIPADGQCTIVFTSLSPSYITSNWRSKRNRLEKFMGHNPLLSLPRNVSIYELSALNSGVLFDLELEAAWKELTGHSLKHTGRLWLYRYS